MRQTRPHELRGRTIDLRDGAVVTAGFTAGRRSGGAAAPTSTGPVNADLWP